MNRQTRNVLERASSDLHIIDLDLQFAPDRVSFLGVADHLQDAFGRTPAILVVHFLEVESMSFGFVRYDQAQRSRSGPLQWLIHELELSKSENRWKTRLTGALSGTPLVEIVCSDIDVQNAYEDELHRIFPGWNKPGNALLTEGFVKRMQQTTQG